MEKSKVTSPILFRKTIDMNTYLAGNHDSQMLYNLTAVLLHQGNDTNTGHYISRAMDQQTGKWYHFDDSNVSEVSKLHFDINNWAFEKKTQQEPALNNDSESKQNKGVFKSSNAYVLVYTRSDLPVNEVVVPSDLQELIDNENKLLAEKEAIEAEEYFN
jgi:ubiquitin carboxyl-terminal hydrolase 48